MQAPGDPIREPTPTSRQGWTPGRHRWRPLPTCLVRRAVVPHPRVAADLRARPRDPASLRRASGWVPCDTAPWPCASLRGRGRCLPIIALRVVTEVTAGLRDPLPPGLLSGTRTEVRAPSSAPGRAAELAACAAPPAPWTPRGRGTAAGELLDVKELTGLALSVEPFWISLNTIAFNSVA